MSFGSYNIVTTVIVLDPEKAINIGDWSICGLDPLDRFDIYVYIYINIYSKTSLNRLIMGPTTDHLPLREVVGLGS